MNTIQEYNEYLLSHNINIELIDYFKNVHIKFYNTVDITFMDYFLEICDKEDEFYIEHIKLQEYDVINNIKSSNILDCLAKFNLNENINYRVLDVQQPVRQGGFSIKKQYMLTPHAFKLCLMRAKNSKVYANYYLLLEKVFKFFNDYRIEYQKNIIKNISKENQSLHNKIDEVLKNNKDILNENKEQSKQIEELLNYCKKTTNKLDEVQDELNEMAEEFEDLHEKVDKMKDAFEDTANRSVPDPEDEDLKSEYILLQCNENLNEFVFIRGIKEYNDKKIVNRYNEDYKIVAREFNANPIQLFKLFKKIVEEEFKEAKRAIINNKTLKNKMKLRREVEKIKFSSNKLELKNNFTMGQLLLKIKKISEMKFKEYEESTDY